MEHGVTEATQTTTTFIFHKSPHQFHNLLPNGFTKHLLWRFQLIKSIQTKCVYSNENEYIIYSSLPSKRSIN